MMDDLMVLIKNSLEFELCPSTIRFKTAKLPLAVYQFEAHCPCPVVVPFDGNMQEALIRILLVRDPKLMCRFDLIVRKLLPLAQTYKVLSSD